MPELTSPEALLKAMAASRHGCVIVDFDHTLYRDNSTLAFLGLGQQYRMGRLAQRVAGKAARLLFRDRSPAMQAWYDYLRVVATVCFCPQAVSAWRQGAAIQAVRINHELADAVRKHPARNKLVLSYGFGFIIGPLLNATRMDAGLISSDLPPWRNLRIRGKLAALHGRADLDDTLFITDSLDDADVLDRIRDSYLVEWPS